jgi:Gpi18-like mannosyltransferase
MKRDYIALSFAVILCIASLVARIFVLPIVVSDYVYFLSPWFDTLQKYAGLTAFQTPFADYAPLYLYALKILTVVPLPSLLSIKLFSTLFDVVIAGVVFVMLGKTTNYSRATRALCFAIMVCVPTMLINSSLWGQSDAIYTAAVVVAFYFLLIDRPLSASVAFGVALSIKIQAIFFLPVLVGYFWRTKSDLWYVLLLPALFLLSLIPAWLGGGTFLQLATIYAHQAGEYSGLNVSSQSIYAFTNGLTLSPFAVDILFWFGIILAALSACIILMRIAFARVLSPERLAYYALLCVLVIPYFLPRMHERYFYLADVFSVIYSLYKPRMWYIPTLVVSASLLSYMPYLSHQVAFLAALHVDLRIPSLIMLVTVILLAIQNRPRAEYAEGLPRFSLRQPLG